MKKLLVAGLLSLTALSVFPQLSEAFFKCFRCKRKCHDCCTFCVRPYNAFSPVCFGSVTCTGCSPLNLGCGPTMGDGGCGPAPYMPSCFNSCQPSCSSGCCDGGCLPPAGPMVNPGPVAQMPNMLPGNVAPQAMPQGQQFAPPPAGAVNPSAYQWGYAPYLYNYGLMQTAANQPNYYGNYAAPGYGYPQYYQGYGNGYGYNPTSYGRAPSYWYGN